MGPWPSVVSAAHRTCRRFCQRKAIARAGIIVMAAAAILSDISGVYGGVAARGTANFTFCRVLFMSGH